MMYESAKIMRAKSSALFRVEHLNSSTRQNRRTINVIFLNMCELFVPPSFVSQF